MSTLTRVPWRLQRPPARLPAAPTKGDEPGLVERYKQWLGLSTVAAAISYATLWLAYAQFYLEFGTTPEEAGIDKTDLLSQAIVGPAVFFLLAFLLLFLYALAFSALGAIYASMFRDLVSLARTLRKPAAGRKAPEGGENSFRAIVAETRDEFAGTLIRQLRKPKRILRFTVPATFVILCMQLFSESTAAATNVQNGYSVAHPSISFGSVDVPLFGIRAAPVRIQRMEEPPPAVTASSAFPQCLMHVGEADGKTLLYNARLESLVRLPTQDAVFILEPQRDLPDICRDDNVS